MKTPDYGNMQNLCKSKGEEELRRENNTTERGFKNECECRQTSVHTILLKFTYTNTETWRRLMVLLCKLVS